MDGDQATSPTVDEVVAQAVRMGYHVIEENIQQGRLAAERVRNNDYRASDMSDDAANAAKRLVRLARELSTTWFDLIAAAMRDPGLQSALARPTEAATQARHARERMQATAVPVASIVRSSRQVEVMPLTLQAPDGPAVPTITGLYSTDPRLPPITTVVFRIASDKRGPLVEIYVLDDQPPGTYNGVVVDSDSQRPLGTLTVRVLP